jgi:hypothetical protein
MALLRRSVKLHADVAGYQMMNTHQHEILKINGGWADEDPARGRSSADGAPGSAVADILVNADDWGRDTVTTDRSLECHRQGAISSVSAMVFMEDSERAAGIARLHRVDAGLHLNFTLAFSAQPCSSRLTGHQERLSRFLRMHGFAQVAYHPGLAGSFEYVVKAQLEEFERLYGAPPNRVDGHDHMHLCTNVIRQELLPAGVIVRRNLSFGRSEKSYLNRAFRRWRDRRLARRHWMTDFFFDLHPLEPRQRLAGILELAARFDVEMEAHPIRDDEYRFLIDGGLLRCGVKVAVSRGYMLRFGNSDRADCSPAMAGEVMRWARWNQRRAKSR